MYPFLLAALLLAAVPVAAQPSVRFTRLPASLQLYPRDVNNQAAVAVRGTVLTSGHRRVSLLVFRDKTLHAYYSQPLTYQSGGADFSFSTTLKAELIDYHFRVYIQEAGGDSVLVADRQNVVAGDAFVVNGQSNVLGFPYDKPISPFSRTVGGLYYLSDTTLWQRPYFNAIGYWPTELQQLLIARQKVPVAIFNGGVGGAPSGVFVRVPGAEYSLDNAYGRLYDKVRKAGLLGTVKAYFWLQGEAETSGDASPWPSNFDALYKAIMQDYPGLARLYVLQTNILDDLANRRQPVAALRDFQRRTRQLYPNVETYATVGAKQYDGIHYGPEGSEQIAAELYRLVTRDFYGSTDTTEIRSPDIRHVFYTSPNRDEIGLIFDEGQRMIVQTDTLVPPVPATGYAFSQNLKDLIYFDGRRKSIQSFRAEGNRVYLKLDTPVQAKTLMYLPPYYPWNHPDDAPLPFRAPFLMGPMLRNSRGLRAFTFEHPIAEPLPSFGPLKVRAEVRNELSLSWTDIAGESRYVLERSVTPEHEFRVIARLSANETSFTDRNLTDNVVYYYRLRAEAKSAEALALGNARTLFTTSVPVLQVTDVQIRPNPASGRVHLSGFGPGSSIVQLLDLRGRLVRGWNTSQRELEVPLDAVESGLYFVRINDGSRVVVQKLVVR